MTIYQIQILVDDDIPNSDTRRYFVRPCMPSLEMENDGLYSSVDLSGMYNNACHYGNTLEECGLARSPNKDCHEKDHHFTFKDEIGKVVHVPDNPDDEMVFRSMMADRSNWFARSEPEFLKPDGNYQVWFVQRNRYEKIIQKKEPFRVVWPRCTFDSVNGRYFPFTQLDNVGHRVAAI